MIFSYLYNSPIGTLILLKDEDYLAEIYFASQRQDSEERLSSCHQGNATQFAAITDWLDCYFAKEPLPPTPPYVLRTTLFSQRTLEITKSIPYGTTATYGEVAQMLERALGQTVFSRAVGVSLAKNPLLLLIPCHRVVAKNGIGGYSGGIERKRALLALEARE